MIHFPFTTMPATFLERPNRYTVVAQLHGDRAIVRAHCPNPGRLGELLVPGATVYLSVAAPSMAMRKTGYDLRFVEHPEHGQLISLDTRLPNQLFAAGLHQGFFAPFLPYTHVAHEVPLVKADQQVTAATIHSRLDFRLTDPAGQDCWVEIKSVSLVIAGCARFPDAVTERGRRHVLELAELVAAGGRAAIVFIVQRPDAHELRPQWQTDPAFGEALIAARQAGVAIYAYTCALTLQAVWLEREISVVLARDAA